VGDERAGMKEEAGVEEMKKGRSKGCAVSACLVQIK